MLIQRRGAEAQRLNAISSRVIGCAIEVHRALGPGLLESAHAECLCFELAQAGLRFERQVPLPVVYKAVKLDCGYRMDLVVEDLVVVELKAIEAILPVHEAQLLTYLKLAEKPLGLLINFYVQALRQGIRRLINSDASASLRLCVEEQAPTHAPTLP